MSERGESLDPVSAKRRIVAEAAASRGRVHRGLESQNLRPPNMRVQRSRSSPSALRDPLTRRPLGRTMGRHGVMKSSIAGGML